MGRAPDRVVVIGGGIIGAAITFHLARRGAHVTLLDAQQPGGGASRVSFAWINAHSKNPFHYHDLNRRSMDMWDRFARLLGDEAAPTWGGEIRWAATPAGGAALQERVAQLQQWGYPIRALSPEELHELEPELVTGPVTAASYSEFEGHVNAPQVVAACVKEATAAGATVVANAAATGMKLDRNGRVGAVQAADDAYPCDTVVLAGGPDTTALARLAGIHAPVYHTFGCTMVTAPQAPIFRNAALIHTPRDAEPPLNIRQFPDGAVMVHGGTHGEVHDRSMGETEEELDAVLETAARYLPALAGMTVREVRKGRRPIPQDGWPILGFSPARPNVYIAATHSGVTLAALMGEMVTSEILDGADIELLAPYRPDRFGPAVEG